MAVLEIFAFILGSSPASRNMFAVKAQDSITVDDWRDLVYEKAKSRLKGVAAIDLVLWRLNEAIPSKQVAPQVSTLGGDLSKVAEEMLPTDALLDYFPKAPALKSLHVIVVPGGYEELKPQKVTSPEVLDHVDAVRFLTEKVGSYTIEGLRHVSNDTHLHKGARAESSPFGTDDYQPLPFVSKWLGELDAKRPVSQAQLQQLLQIFDQATCTTHFEVSEPNGMSPIELKTYTTGLSSHSDPLEFVKGCSTSFKDGHVTVYLVDPALTPGVGVDKPWKYDKDVGWNPLLLQGAFADPDSLYTFNPRSDFSLFEDVYGPLIMGEMISEDEESDRWRMLFQGTAVCRYQNMIRGDREAIILCLYLNKNYEMEHYLVYQAAESDKRDVHILHDLTLDLSKIGNAFLLSKRLFNFQHRLIQFPEIDARRRKTILGIQKQVRDLYNTSVTAAQQAKSKGRHSSQPSSTLERISEDAVLRVSFKTIQVLNHVRKDVATAIRRSDMQPVVLKRIRTNSSELRILRLLQFCAVQGSNYIIPLLEVIERPLGISTLVMPHYTPVLELETDTVEELALQLIRGVSWLHRQLISHSDIKERNLVFDERQNCLFIIDFGLAIQLTSREQKVRGARGTAEHVAPEVGIKSSWKNRLQEVSLDEESVYIPMLADIWAVGDVINQWLQSSTESIRTVMGKVAKELQAVDPTKRLSLHDAEIQIAAACSIATTAPCPLATSGVMSSHA